jgi:hypothetical protein
MKIGPEDMEQMNLVRFLDRNNLLFTHIPNSTWTPSWSQKHKNKHMGVRRGFPDMVICIPKNKSKDGEPWLLFIELKKKRKMLKSGKPSKSRPGTTPEQDEWLEFLGGVPGNTAATVSCGAYEAKQFIVDYMRNPAGFVDANTWLD